MRLAGLAMKRPFQPLSLLNNATPRNNSGFAAKIYSARLAHSIVWRSLFAMGVIVGASLTALRSILFVSGVPALQHDWAWSPVQSQLQTLIHDRLSIFQPGGMQGYNVDALSYAPLTFANCLAWLFSSNVTLEILLLLFVVCSAYGATLLAQRQGAKFKFSIIIGLLYAFGPVYVNKLGSGQINAWAAYAALPWAFRCIQNLDDVFYLRRIAILGLCAVFIAAQIHVFLIFSLFVIGLLLFMRRWVQLLQAIIGLSLGAASQAFSIAQSLFAFSANAIDQYPARVAWESDQSPHFLDAVGLTGYYARYFEAMTGTAFPWIHWAQIALAILAFWGLLQSKAWLPRASALIGVVILLLVSSFHTPLQPVASWVFQKYTWASLFRELYNNEELLAVIYCVGLGCALANSRMRLVALPIMVLLLLSYVLPSYARVVHIAQLDRHVSAARYLERQPGNTGIWPVPNGRFLTDGTSSGGYDPFQGRLGSHPIIEQYFATGAIAVAVSRSMKEAEPLLRAMGAEYVWCRDGLLWKPPHWSMSVPTVRPSCNIGLQTKVISGDTVGKLPVTPEWHISTKIAVTPDIWSLALHELRAGDFVFAKDAIAFGVDEGVGNLHDDRRATNPTQGPVPQVLGNRADPRFSEIAVPANVVALRYYQRLASAEPAYRIIVASHLRAGQPLYRSSTYQVVLCRVLTKCVSSNDAFIIASPPLRSPLMKVQFITLRDKVILINNRQYRPAWHASVNGVQLPHFRVNGFANGWLVPRSDIGRISFSDRTQDILAALRIFSLAAVGIVAVLLVTSLWYHPRSLYRAKSGETQ
jgi:hypothetical protein